MQPINSRYMANDIQNATIMKEGMSLQSQNHSNILQTNYSSFGLDSRMLCQIVSILKHRLSIIQPN